MSRAAFVIRSVVFLLAMASAVASAQGPFLHTATHVHAPGSEPREHPVDMLSMVIDVRFDPAKGLVRGAVTHRFRVLQRRVDSIVFDGHAMTIRQATLGGKPVRYRITDTTVVVYPEPSLRWDREDSVTFAYEATPRKGIYFIGWNDSTGRMRRQIWTQGQGIDHRHWIPMYDEMNDKMITETIVTFDSAYTVLSNGKAESVVTNGDGTKTWHHRMTKPHASYLLMLAIGKYAIEERRSRSGVPLFLYSYPERPDQVEPTYRLSAEAMDFLEREIGLPYPWDTYSQVPVADYVFGAMENTTATIFGDFYLTDARAVLDRSYLGVNVHELTHQWFGDYITGRSTKSMWLQESFATFYPHLFTRTIAGDDAYAWSRRGMHRTALAASEKDRLPIVHPASGTARVYPKGASVIDMMRYTFGEEETRRAIRHYLLRHAYGNVQTSDLYLSFQDTLGITPDWFFDQWLYRGGEPHYAIAWKAGGAAGTTVTIDQIHPMDELVGPFAMPLVIDVHYVDGSHDSIRPFVRDARTVLTVPNPQGKPVSFVLFDPGSWVLKQVTFPKAWDELAAQVRRAPQMIDRYDALVAMRDDSVHGQERLAILDHVIGNEATPAMRVEAVQQAVRLDNEAARALVRRAFRDTAVDVRTAALQAWPTVRPEHRADVETLLDDPSYAIVQQAFLRLCQSFPSDVDRYLGIVAGQRGAHERIRIARHEVAAGRGDTAAVAALVDLAGPSWEFITRQNAMQALKRLSVMTPSAAQALLDAAWSTNGRLAAAAQGVLGYLVEQGQHRATLRQVLDGRSLAPWQRAMVEPWVR